MILEEQRQKEALRQEEARRKLEEQKRLEEIKWQEEIRLQEELLKAQEEVKRREKEERMEEERRRQEEYLRQEERRQRQLEDMRRLVNDADVIEREVPDEEIDNALQEAKRSAASSSARSAKSSNPSSSSVPSSSHPPEPAVVSQPLLPSSSEVSAGFKEEPSSLGDVHASRAEPQELTLGSVGGEEPRSPARTQPIKPEELKSPENDYRSNMRKFFLRNRDEGKDMSGSLGPSSLISNSTISPPAWGVPADLRRTESSKDAASLSSSVDSRPSDSLPRSATAPIANAARSVSGDARSGAQGMGDKAVATSPPSEEPVHRSLTSDSLSGWASISMADVSEDASLPMSWEDPPPQVLKSDKQSERLASGKERRTGVELDDEFVKSVNVSGEFVIVEDHFVDDSAALDNILEEDEEDDLILERIRSLEEQSKRATGEEANRVSQELLKLKQKVQRMKTVPMQVDGEQYGDVRITYRHHKFRPKPLGQELKLECDVCHKPFKTVLKLRERFQCVECKTNVHKKCAAQLNHDCFAHKFPTKEYLLKICPDEGLDAQGYKCDGCSVDIGFNHELFQQASICDYTGKYYCPECHKGDLMTIPARVIKNWDFAHYPVSKASKELLKVLLDKHILRIEACNPRLLAHIEELREIKSLRVRLHTMYIFLSTCRLAKESGFAAKFTRLPLVLDVEVYSLQDLIDIHDGSLRKDLLLVRNEWEKHIKQDCPLCAAKGFICEVCKDHRVIYPFDPDIAQCSSCSAVYHSWCFNSSKSCPKCERRQRRGSFSVQSSVSP